MTTLDVSSSVWFTGFWGFDPEEEGILGFTDPNDRDRLFTIIDERQLVCIYGAASPQTDSKLVHHLLGVIEVERTPIDSWEKMSDFAKARSVRLGRQDKWRHAMPVRRAWRTSHTLDVKQVFPKSYDPSNGRYIARFGTWLVPDESRWLLEKVPFVETNVYGEAPVHQNDESEAETGSLALFLKPSKGVFGRFGDRSYEVQDRPHALYLAQFLKAADLLAGRPIASGAGLVKIGISGDIRNRLKALNLSFPPTSNICWKITRAAKFPNRDSAGEAEAAFKSRAVDEFGAASLGKEYFVMELNKAEALFNALSPATGLDLRVSAKSSK
ncbi:GIY-YIG nuclease family protein [Rhodopseudomonas palustris]|uniref:GIY-YIG nuclease family protein n=1 Tax=Rhodopseudomonas palustris TaxID=1076 RepID=UPI0022F08C52|nr:GIY-YIG nuclease family protein [Rhodopseudomonas palustris]WBU27742.1 GIY-YIG nuclease family protein [Rhodopseudomonas palustris]